MCSKRFKIDGTFALLLQSYRLAARTRCIDESRSVLRTLVTEFMPPTKTTDNPVLFTATSAPTGTGLVWNGTSGTASGLDVQIGEDSGMPVFAHVTRTVSELNETTGVADVSPAGGGNSGRLIQCCLTLGFTAAGQTWSDTVVLTRSTQ